MFYFSNFYIMDINSLKIFLSLIERGEPTVLTIKELSIIISHKLLGTKLRKDLNKILKPKSIIAVYIIMKL